MRKVACASHQAPHKVREIHPIHHGFGTDLTRELRTARETQLQEVRTNYVLNVER